MALKIDRRLVLRNTLLNALGSLAPMAITLATLPRVLTILGPERYGILSLVLVVVGYFSVLDLGFAQAMTKFAAESLGRGREEELPETVWTAVAFQSVLGSLGGFVLAAAAPALASRWLTIPAGMQTETRAALELMGLMVPVMMISPCLSGVLEAAQRFDIILAVSVPAGAASTIAMYAGAVLGWGLPGIMVLLIAARALMTAAYFVAALRLFPVLRRSLVASWGAVVKLLRYGSWFAASGIVVPVLMYTDRFLVGRYLTLADITYYAVPFGFMTRLLFLPQSLVRTLFPAFSALEAGDKGLLEDLFLRSHKYMTLAGGPVVLFLTAFSFDLFALWLGPETAAHAAPVLRLLLFGGLFSILGPIAAALLQGTGRPDIVVKWYVACLPINAAAVWVLIKAFGLAGAALSFDVRAVAETVVFAVAAARLAGISYQTLAEHRLWQTLGVIAFLGVLMALTHLPATIAGRAAACAAGTAVFFAAGWVFMLDDADRGFIKEQLRLRIGRRLGTA